MPCKIPAIFAGFSIHKLEKYINLIDTNSKEKFLSEYKMGFL
jgi:hypothetical protein